MKREKTLPAPAGREFRGMAGAHAAMLTPFTKDDKVNEEAIEQIIDYGIREGLAGFYLTGSSGEGMLLTHEERVTVYRRAVKAARGRCKLTAQVGTVRTDDAVRLARAAADAGVDWISAVAPVYFGQSFAAQLRHYKAISGATDRPFMVYCFNQTLVPERDIRLFDLPNVKGMKYTGTNYYAVQTLRAQLDKEAIFFAGADEQLVCALALGDTFSGGIGLHYNMIPRHFAQICVCAARNDFAAAGRWQAEANRLVRIVLRPENWENWSSFRALMTHVGIDCGSSRAPYAPLPPARIRALARAFADLNLVPRNAARHPA